MAHRRWRPADLDAGARARRPGHRLRRRHVRRRRRLRADAASGAGLQDPDAHRRRLGAVPEDRHVDRIVLEAPPVSSRRIARRLRHARRFDLRRRRRHAPVVAARLARQLHERARPPRPHRDAGARRHLRRHAAVRRVDDAQRRAQGRARPRQRGARLDGGAAAALCRSRRTSRCPRSASRASASR